MIAGLFPVFAAERQRHPAQAGDEQRGCAGFGDHRRHQGANVGGLAVDNSTDARNESMSTGLDDEQFGGLATGDVRGEEAESENVTRAAAAEERRSNSARRGIVRDVSQETGEGTDRELARGVRAARSNGKLVHKIEATVRIRGIASDDG